MAKKPLQRSKFITRSEIRWKTVAIIVLSIFCVLVIAPTTINRGINWLNKKTNIGFPALPQSGFNLGLDLQGGAHLIYRANTDQIAASDRAGAVEGVRDVIERRVRGGLGVSEPLVQTTQVGSEYRIIVELPGVVSTTEAIKMIGATPVLEFKEINNVPQRELTADEQKQLTDFNTAAQKKAREALSAAQKTTDFAHVVQQYSEDVTSTRENGGDLGFIKKGAYPELYSWAATHKNNEVGRDVVKTNDGYNVVKRIAERNGDKTITAAHILICYKGAERCDNPAYTKEEALAKVLELKKQATIQNFSDLAKKYSTEPNAATSGGALEPFTKGAMVKPFEDAVWDAPVNQITGPVETQYGYHLVYKKAERIDKEYQVARVIVKTKSKTDIVPPAVEWKSTGLSGKQLKRAEVTQDSRTGVIQVALQFDDEGTKLFSEITTRNVQKQVAILLDGTIISAPAVSQPINSGQAVITGNFNFNDAKKLAQRLNSGALPVPVEVISQERVDATLGMASLQRSFEAGLIGLLLVMVFMTIYYRLPGALSVVSLAIYTVLNLSFFKLAGVTLTLSGIAGFVLSIGMAVDANVLVFERLKEELRSGKTLATAMEESFLRAWPSIRDGHVTTLISCVILMWFGSGFVKGFAVVLATGVIVSLFTAVTVTRTIMRLVVPWFKQEGNRLFLGYKKINNDKNNI